MPIKQEELWTPVEHPSMYIVTTNAYFTNDGRLVMGRGAAKEATEKIPGIDREVVRVLKSKLGQSVDDIPNGKLIYGFKTIRHPRPDEGKAGFGIFQVKYDFKDTANPALILNSMAILRTACHLFPTVKFRMNYPGIGNGNLQVEDVRPLLDEVPANLTVCYREE